MWLNQTAIRLFPLHHWVYNREPALRPASANSHNSVARDQFPSGTMQEIPVQGYHKRNYTVYNTYHICIYKYIYIHVRYLHHRI